MSPELKSQMVAAHRAQDWELARQLSAQAQAEKRPKKPVCQWPGCGVRLAYKSPRKTPARHCVAHYIAARYHEMRGALAACLMLSACYVLAQPLPMPSLPFDAGDTNPVPPILYATTLAWNAQTNADAFRIRCGTNDITLTATNVMIQTPQGSHPLTLVALKHISNGVPPLESLPVETNLVVSALRIVGVDVVAAASPLGPWAKEPLPEPQTNSTGSRYFKLSPWNTNAVRRELR